MEISNRSTNDISLDAAMYADMTLLKERGAWEVSSEVNGFVRLNFEGGTLDDERIINDLSRVDLPILYIDSDSRPVGFALPACFNGDFFFVESCERIHIHSDMFELAKEIGAVTYDHDEINFLLEKGYCEPGRTVLNEINRLKGYSFYQLDDQGMKIRALGFLDVQHYDEDDLYEDFKSRLNDAIEMHVNRTRDMQNVLLLSGGADSRLLFLLLKKHGVDFVTKTVSYEPMTFTDNAVDVMIAESVSRLGGVKSTHETIDIEQLHADYIDDVIRLIPCSPHFSFSFKAALSNLPYGNIAVWTGQNMDSLYNLGPTGMPELTGSGISQWFKRFFLTKEYVQTLPDVEGKGRLRSRLLAYSGKWIYKLTHIKQRIDLPKNAADYLERYRLQDDYLLLRPCGSFPLSDAPVSYQEIKSRLYEDKMAFLHGGDPQSISACARLTGGTVIYPYSHTSMIQWFQSKDLTMDDVWHPKRYVYRYIKELSEELGPRLGSFEKPDKPSIEARFGKTGTIKEYEEMVEKSQFGFEANPNGVKTRSVYQLVRYYWIKKTNDFLDELGVRHDNLKA